MTNVDGKCRTDIYQHPTSYICGAWLHKLGRNGCCRSRKNLKSHLSRMCVLARPAPPAACRCAIAVHATGIARHHLHDTAQAASIQNNQHGGSCCCAIDACACGCACGLHWIGCTTIWACMSEVCRPESEGIKLTVRVLYPLIASSNFTMDECAH